MIVSRLILKNWRNFKDIDILLRSRQFVLGPNASGKSNLLDLFRFLRDIAKEGGGLQKAITDRNGLSKIRCLAARRAPDVCIEIFLSEDSDSESSIWRYAIGIHLDQRRNHKPLLLFEKVWKHNKLILSRPDKHDKSDRERLTQTHLEQVNSNREFRDIADFLKQIDYLHLVPQLLRYPDIFKSVNQEGDPFGHEFLERIAKTPEKTRRSRLEHIEKALRIAVPQLKEIALVKDDITGAPHLEARYEHWRSRGGRQREDQFSDGTLRLIGLFWAMLESKGLLLLEEPELSLNSGVVSQLAPLIHQVQKKRKQQLIITTHSESLLNDPGIDGREVLLLEPDMEGTKIAVATDIPSCRHLLESGMNVADAVLSRTRSNDPISLPL